MANFKETYIQIGIDLSLALSTTGLTVKSVSCPTFPDLKDVPVKDDPESSGITEFFPDTAYFKSYEMTINFAYQGNAGTGYAIIKSALDSIQGQEFSILDVYQNIGKRCRYAGYGEDGTYILRDGVETIEFSVKLKVNNPTTYGVFMPNGTIVAYMATDSKAWWSDGTTNDYVAGELMSKTITGGEAFVIFEPVGGLRGWTGLRIPRVVTSGENRIDTNDFIRFVTIK